MASRDQGPLIVAIGEPMLRLSSPLKSSLSTANHFEICVAGSELNLLIASQALGASGRFVTRLPDSELAQIIRRHVLSYGLDLQSSEEAGSRVGLFFYESGAPPRPSRVLYDRRDSAASHLRPDTFDWDEVLDGANCAHTSGITSALGDGPHQSAITFLATARRLGITTSYDMNFRAQLWSIEAARRCYEEILPFVDFLFVSPNDLSMMCGRDADVNVLAAEVTARFRNSNIIIRERFENSGTEFGAIVRVFGHSEIRSVAKGLVVDELGAGDAAAAAFLTSILLGATLSESAERCARAYARMLTIPGDAWSGSMEDLTTEYQDQRRVQR